MRAKGDDKNVNYSEIFFLLSIHNIKYSSYEEKCIFSKPAESPSAR